MKPIHLLARRWFAGRARGAARARRGERMPSFEALEPRVLLNGDLGMIEDVLLSGEVDYGTPGSQVQYAFVAEFYVDEIGVLDYAVLRTPTGADYKFTEHVAGFENEFWHFSYESAKPEGLYDFVPGTYTLYLDFGSGYVSTQFLFAEPGSTNTPLDQPTQKPVITSPTFAQIGVATNATIQWEPVTDDAVDVCIIALEDPYAVLPVLYETLDADNDSIGPLTLQTNHFYEGSLAFAYGYAGLVNANGIEYTVGNTNRSAFAFNTYNIHKPDLVTEVIGTTLPDLMVPGDKGTVTLRVTNWGLERAVGSLVLGAMLSYDDDLSDDDPVLAAFAGKSVNLAPGKSMTTTIKAQVPVNTPAGDYHLAGIAYAGGTLDEIDDDNNFTIREANRPLRWAFGQVGLRNNVPLSVVDNDGTLVTVKLTGPGVGSIDYDGDTQRIDIDVVGTTVKSSIAVTAKGGDNRVRVTDADVEGSLKAVKAPGVDLIGNLHVTGWVGALTLGNAQSNTQHSLRIDGNGAPVKITMDRVSNLNLFCTPAIAALTAKEWLDTGGGGMDILEAPSLKKLTVKGDKKLAIAGDCDLSLEISGNLVPPAMALGGAKIAGGVGGRWNVDGSSGAIAAARALDWRLTVAEDLKSVTLAGDMLGVDLTVQGLVGSIKAGYTSFTHVNAGALKSLTAARMFNCAIDVAGEMGTLKAIDWTGAGALHANLLHTLTITGDKKQSVAGNFTPDVAMLDILNLYPAIGSAKIAGEISGHWQLFGSVNSLAVGSLSPTFAANIHELKAITVAGNASGVLAAEFIGKVSIGGDLIDAMILAGADLGTDLALGGDGPNADGCGRGCIVALKVAGAIDDCIIAAGLSHENGVIGDNDDWILDGIQSHIASITAGSLDASSLFLAGAFPATVKIAGQSIDPMTLANFRVPD